MYSNPDGITAANPEGMTRSNPVAPWLIIPSSFSFLQHLDLASHKIIGKIQNSAVGVRNTNLTNPAGLMS